ncbi:MAG: Fic family protein [Myxococcota bacterium]
MEDPLVQALKGSSLEERVQQLNELKQQAPRELIDAYHERLDMSWIYHDSALEGVVYTKEELTSAILDQVVSDSSLIPVYDEIRNFKGGVDLVRTLSEKKRPVVGLEVVKNIYSQLTPEEVDGKGAPKYRKDMPLHRLYFHEISAPEKISYKMRQLMQWVSSPDTRRSTHPIRLASKTHVQLLHIYPFPRNSGKVARLLMNLILMRHGYPPAVLHATERQRYYEALKSSEDAVANLIHEALVTSVESAVRLFETAAEEESNGTRVQTA